MERRTIINLFTSYITNEANEKVSIKPKIWNWNNEDNDFLMIYIRR